MSVTGDFAELDQLIERFGDMAHGNAAEALARNLAEEALEQVAEGFEEGRDPYGREWAALRSRDGQPLRDTSHMANSFHVHEVEADGFSIRTGVWYAVVHQDGKTITPNTAPMLVFPTFGGSQTWRAHKVTIPQRRMLPDVGDIPSAWRSAFDEVGQEFLDDFFR